MVHIEALVSRQFVDMSRIRIEGYLAAFPKLVGTGKQHTYVETENVYIEALRLLSKLVPEYSYLIDEEGICRSAFEIHFAFDQVISLGHKENVTVVQVKQYCEMESNGERLHKMVLQSKINETKDVMKRKASEIDKSKIEKGRSDKGGFMSMGSGRMDTGFGSDNSMSGSGGFGGGSGFGLNTEVDSFSAKPKALVSRQFVDMSRIRIEGYLAAFPKLVGTGKQHTYVETENVCYVYQHMESLYLLLVTNKQSNILEDIEALRLLSKLVPEYSYSIDEEGICRSAFEIHFAFDQVISLGHKENVTVVQVKQYCEMESNGERLHKMVLQSKINETKDVMKRKASEIDKSKIEKGRSDKGGFMSMVSERMDTGFGSDNSVSGSGGFGGGSGFGLNTEVDSFSAKPKGPSGRPVASAPAPSKKSWFFQKVLFDGWLLDLRQQVVLAASILSKCGKAFPKLVGTGKQHTYVETANVLCLPAHGAPLLASCYKQTE
ncbi:hypothetical protein OROMI_014943 [Orobanche minor]